MSKKQLSIIAVSMGCGGAEKVISLMLPFLVKKYRVKLFLLYDIFHFDVPDEVEIVLLSNNKSLGTLQKILLFPKAIFKVFSHYKKDRPDVSLSFLIRPNFINCMAKMRFPKIRTVLSERCYPSAGYKDSKLKDLFYSRLIPYLFNKADYLFSNSKFINADLKETFGVKIPMEVIYNPVEIKEANKDIKKKSDSTTTILSVGSFRPVKNQRLLIDAAVDIKFPYKIIFLGDGQDFDEMKDLIKELNLDDHIEMKGSVPNVSEYLQEADIYAMSSNSEGFPNSLLEAMAAGKKIVTTNCVSGPQEMFEQPDSISIPENGFLETPYGLMINIKDSIAMTKALTFLRDNPSGAEQMSVNAFRRAQDYSVPAFINKLEKIILV